jgi:CubicO group peptidase (beta-lactamase class C family)
MKFLAFILILAALQVSAAPDEELLGKSKSYPVGTIRNWFFDESVRVGSFTHQAEIPGVFNGKANEMKASHKPMLLAKVDKEPDYRWSIDSERGLSVKDYLDRQRTMALLIIKDGVIQVERYQYDRTAQDRFVSQSMAKSVTSIAVGIALREGKIASVQDRADKYAPSLSGTLYGETKIISLLRMASGAKYEELYNGKDDHARYGAAAHTNGAVAGAKVITERIWPEGQKFNYASAETDMLAHVLFGATGQNLSNYLTTRLWQPMGAETSALWRADKNGIERAGGNFNATARDFARLGVLLANDGVRPDAPELGEIIPTSYLMDATDAGRHDAAFKPRVATPYFGYGYKFWTFPSNTRRFALLGVYGQTIYVDPQNKLVLVHLAANKTAKAGQTTMGRELDALWRGVVAKHGKW